MLNHAPHLPAPTGLAKTRPLWQWLTLILATALVSTALEWLGLPGAFLIGAMIMGVTFSAYGATVRMPRRVLLVAQALFGTAIGTMISPGIIATFAADWVLFTVIVVSIILMSTLTGWGLAWRGIVPGSTAIWGSSPGAASAMLIMSEAYGADTRLVAFMQYLRVLCVCLAAAIVAHFGVSEAGPPVVHTVFAAISFEQFGTALLIALVGGVAGKLLRLPSGVFLMPFILSGILNATELAEPQVPAPLLFLCYAIVGLNVGLAFTRPILLHARRASPAILLSILVLMAFSGVLALLLVTLTGIDPLTAYLATSPGGMDSIAIIAASSHVDMGFVMSLQTARLVIVTLLGPSIARFMAKTIPHFRDR